MAPALRRGAYACREWHSSMDVNSVICDDFDNSVMHNVDILIPSYAVWPVSRYELELVVAQSDRSRDLIVVSCDGSLSFCPVRDLDKNFSCYECQKFRAKQLKIMKKLSDYKKITEFTLSDAVSITIDNEFDVDYSDQVTYSESTIMTELKSKHAVRDYPNIYSEIMENYELGHKLAQYFIQEYDVENFMIFNARMSFYRAFLFVAQKVPTHALVYEAPMIGDESFIVTENYSIVDRHRWSSDLLNFFSSMKFKISHDEYANKCQQARKWFFIQSTINR